MKSVSLVLLYVLLPSLFQAEIITANIPNITKAQSPFRVNQAQIFSNQHLSIVFNIAAPEYSKKILNAIQLTQQEVQCTWDHKMSNYSSVASANSSDLGLAEDEKILTGGSISRESSYYLLTNKGRVIGVDSEVSTRTMRVSKVIQLSVDIDEKPDILHYRESLVFESKNTLVFVDEEKASYVPVLEEVDILKIVAMNGYIYMLSSTALSRWKDSVIERIPLNSEELNLVDMAANENGTLFVLDSQKGVLVVEGVQSSQFQFAYIQGRFTNIRVLNNTLEIIYILQKFNFIVELYHLSDKLSINKIYPINTHIKELEMFQEYAILIHDYHLTLLRHSASRHIPQLSYSEILSSLVIAGIQKIVRLESKMLLLVSDKGVFLTRQIQIEPPRLGCVFPNPGIFEIDLQFHLPSCLETHESGDPIHEYCLKRQQLQIIVKEGRRRGTVIFAYITFGVMIIVGLIVVALGILYCAKEIKKKQDVVAHIREKNKRRESKRNTTVQLNVTDHPVQISS